MQKFTIMHVCMHEVLSVIAVSMVSSKNALSMHIGKHIKISISHFAEM